MFVSPVSRTTNPDKRAWDNFTLYDRGTFYAFFGTGTRGPTNPDGRPIALDIAVSEDGVHWRFLAREVVPIAGAHAGFGVVRVGERIFYYPTCSTPEQGVHFKVYASRDFLHWEPLGDRYDVAPDRAIYHERWDELMVLKEREGDRDVIYGYISSEVREDVGPPGAGMVRSYDGLTWEVLPPATIDWGEVPAQHMEVNFCERIGDKVYLSMSGRMYLDSYGYSLYTFVGDSPYGPFRPDLPMFRLAGTSRHDVTWLGHTFRTPDDLLVALWLSARQTPEIPSYNFGIGPLKRLSCEDGHLRLRYWPQNEKAKGDRVPLPPEGLRWVHPAASLRTERDTLALDQDAVAISAGRDGALVLIDHRFDPDRGFVIEGRVTAWENRGHIASHQHAAAAGLFLESRPGEGRAIIPDTLGVTRTGDLAYADHRITDVDVYAHAGAGLVVAPLG